MKAAAAIGPAGSDLVIAIGNPLRGDDGAAWWLARRARALRPAPRVLRLQQLTPELGEELAMARRLLILDAWLPPPGIGPCLRRLEPAIPDSGDEGGAFSHVLLPAQLLALTALLHGRVPDAWLLLLPGFRFGHGAGLSPELRRLLPRAEALLRRWWQG